MKKHKRIKLILFWVVFALEYAAGYYINHIRQLISGDALSRVANAFYAIYLDPPHLAAVGFVWNPLPSYIELPMLIFWRIYRPLASSGLAGVIMTALFSAGSAVLIFRSFLEFSNSVWISLLCSLLYAFNPYIFLYGANGMSEAVFIFMIICSIIHLTKWMDDGASHHILKIAFALCFAFLTRYEAVPFIAAIAFCTAIIILIKTKQNGMDNKKYLNALLEHVEGLWILLLTPAVFAVIFWVAYNYIITGNALYFLNSVYSNVGQSGSITNDASIARIIGHPLLVTEFIIKRMIYFLIPFVLIVINRIIDRKLLRKDFLILIIIAVSLYIMQFGLLMKGLSAAWLRYYVYILPVSAAWLPYEMKKSNKIWKVSGISISFMISGALTMFIIFNSQIAPDQFNLTRGQDNGLSISNQNEIAAYINNNHPNSKIYMDSFTTFSIILNCDNPHNIIASSNYDFNKILKDFKHSKVDYLVIPNPNDALGKLDSVNRQYPEIYEKGASWCKLEKTFNNFKLFKVIH